MRRLSKLSSACSMAALRALVWAQLSARQHGQGLVEYGLILVMIMVVCVGILTVVGGKISSLWYNKIIMGW